MTINQILDKIRNSEFSKDKNNKFGDSVSSHILCVFNNKKAYGIWIVKYSDVENICITKIIPVICSGLSLKDLPKSIDKMKVMWIQDIRNEFGSIENAMKNYK